MVFRFSFRPQDQQQLQLQQQQLQQQQCGIASIRLNAMNTSNRQRPATVNVANTSVGIATNNPNIVGNMLPQHVPISYYTHSAPQTSYFNDVLHPMQVIYDKNKICKLFVHNFWVNKVVICEKQIIHSKDWIKTTQNTSINKKILHLGIFFIFCCEKFIL